MIRVRDVARIVERIAPTDLALPDDNPGLQIGNPDDPVRGIFVALDPSPAAVFKAAAAKATLLVTHHPLFYERPKAIDTRTPQGAAAAAALAAGIAVYAAHTNLDAAPDGLGKTVARLLGLEEIAFFAPAAGATRVKLVVFVPEAAAGRVHKALAAAGAGQIGRYDHCAFFSRGEGAFRPLKGAHPAVGVPGRFERLPEVRLEMVADEERLPALVAAIKKTHPYEEPAFDLYPLRRFPAGGLGCIGTVPRTAFTTFVRRAARALQAAVRVSGRPAARIGRVAVVPGSGGSLLGAAARAGADALVTGEIRYHQMREAEHYGLGVIELGHDRSEMPAVALLANIIRKGLAAARRSVPLGVYREPAAGRPGAARR